MGSKKISRRNFFKVSTVTGTGLAFAPSLIKDSLAKSEQTEKTKPATNFNEALNYPRTNNSMPGRYPGKVVRINHPEPIKNNKIIYESAYQMIKSGILKLTGSNNTNDAWLKFVSKDDKIGLKVNPVAGPTLSTSVEVTKAVIDQLTSAGIPKDNILIWDRREEQLFEAGFNEENFPGITIIGTERLGENGTMYDENGELYSLQMIDKDWYYWADVDGEYRPETMPYMVNEGKYSYFTKIITQMVDKVINIPILKNAGSSVTLCLKNLSYGSITNTGRLHQELWSDTIAEVCAFPPIRDKVVLNIVDGIKGCFNGGPSAKPQFFTNYYTIFMGTDPVAVDKIGFDIVTKKRIEKGIQQRESERGKAFLMMAENMKLGFSDDSKIDLYEINL